MVIIHAITLHTHAYEFNLTSKITLKILQELQFFYIAIYIYNYNIFITLSPYDYQFIK